MVFELFFSVFSIFIIYFLYNINMVCAFGVQTSVKKAPNKQVLVLLEKRISQNRLKIIQINFLAPPSRRRNTYGNMSKNAFARPSRTPARRGCHLSRLKGWCKDSVRLVRPKIFQTLISENPKMSKCKILYISTLQTKT